MQVAADTDRDWAVAKARALRSSGRPARITTESIGGILFNRVRVGPYGSEAALREETKKLAAEGLRGWLVRVRGGVEEVLPREAAAAFLAGAKFEVSTPVVEVSTPVVEAPPAAPAEPAAPETPPGPPPATSKFSLTNQYLYYSNQIRGSAPSSSYLNPGHWGTEDLSLSHRYTKGDVSWETQADGRIADDGRIEAHRYNFKRFYTKFGNPKNEAVLGDAVASFTPYSLDSSLKGVRYTRKLGDSADASLVFGMPKSRWEDLWTHELTETVDRKVYGFRTAKRLPMDASVGANVVWSKDSRARYNETATLTNQRIFSADWALPVFRKLAVRGESAFSKTENEDSYGVFTDQKGWAHLLKADYGYEGFKTNNEFERVSPEYATTGGSASPDLIRWRTQNELKLSGPWRLTGAYSWFHNNLVRNDTVDTSTTRMPEAGVRYDGASWRPTFSAESKFRLREVTASTGGKRQRARSIANNVTDRFGPLDASVDYEFQHEDVSDGGSSARHHILGLSLSSSHEPWAGIRVMPSLRYNLQRDRDNVAALTDQTTVVNANLRVKFPGEIDANAGYNRNLVLNAANPNADRRSYVVAIGYNLFKRSDDRVELRFKQNDNRFSTPDKDFKETVGELSLNFALP